MCQNETEYQGGVLQHVGGSANLPEKVSCDVEYRKNARAGRKIRPFARTYAALFVTLCDCNCEISAETVLIHINIIAVRSPSNQPCSHASHERSS